MSRMKAVKRTTDAHRLEVEDAGTLPVQRRDRIAPAGCRNWSALHVTLLMNGHLQHGQSLPSSLLVHLQHKVIWEHVGNEYIRQGGFQKRAGCYRGTRKKIPTFAFMRNHNAIERGLSVQKAVIPESGVQRRNVLLDVYTAMTERQETQKTLQRDECAASPKPS